MNALGMLAEHGPRLLLGVTLVLGLGCLLTALVRDPAARRRSGLWTAVLCALYLVAAAVPMPRLLPDGLRHGDAAAPVPGVAMAEALAELAEFPPPAHTDTPLPVPAAQDAAAPADTPPATTASESSAAAWAPRLAALYAAGSALAAAFWLFGATRLAHVLRRARPAPSPRMLPKGTRLFVVDAAIRPFCYGIVRPTIVVPRSLLAAERTSQLAAVLRHEAAHATARDPLAQALLALLGIALWCHPLFWWLRADVRFQAELCADDAAAAERRTAYARDLLDLAAHASPHDAVPGTVAVFHRSSDFTRRIQMLLQPKIESPLPPSRLRRAAQALSLSALCATAAATFGVPLPAQDPLRAAAQAEVDALREQIAQLKAELAGIKARMANGSLVEVTDSSVEEPPPPPAGDPTNEAAGVPVLQDVPIVSNLFRNPGAQSAQDPAPVAGPAASAEATADLASRVIDLDSEIDLTRTDIATLKPLSDSGRASNADLRKAEVRLRGLERKKRIVQKLVAGEIAATEAEIEWLLRRKKSADKTENLQIDGQIRRATAKLEALRAVN